jgi:hypothetical protein
MQECKKDQENGKTVSQLRQLSTSTSFRPVRLSCGTAKLFSSSCKRDSCREMNSSAASSNVGPHLRCPTQEGGDVIGQFVVADDRAAAQQGKGVVERHPRTGYGDRLPDPSTGLRNASAGIFLCVRRSFPGRARGWTLPAKTDMRARRRTRPSAWVLGQGAQ